MLWRAKAAFGAVLARSGPICGGAETPGRDLGALEEPNGGIFLAQRHPQPRELDLGLNFV